MNERSLREEMLELQRADPRLQAEYNRRIREMMENELKPWQKVFAAAAAAGGVAMFLGLGYLNLLTPPMSLPARVGTTVTMAFALAWTYLALSTLLKGRVTRIHGNVQAGLVWAFVLFLFIGTFIQAGASSDKQFGTWAMLHTLGWLVIGAVFVVVNQIRQSALNIQEEILRLQLRLEQMASGSITEQKASEPPPAS